MGNPFTMDLPKPPKRHFRLLEAEIASLPAELEAAAEEGWQLCGAELSAKPHAYVLLMKFEYAEPTPEQLAAMDAMHGPPLGPPALPIEAMFKRLVRIADFLEDRLGIPREDDLPGEPGAPN